ncbi:TlpA family protein disulfide reductase [Sneathiella aquimaris]|jgi:thiol-disulfide isomerase/thioredoxin|uniref:TlpA family protein disulfide reductase n=1 Tax=Sneathiella aquimaris TaxID=2599305 RepID=UPI001C664298|nr:TlpA disulfide reductase family protein [Sneathiella aquimaris]
MTRKIVIVCLIVVGLLGVVLLEPISLFNADQDDDTASVSDSKGRTSLEVMSLYEKPRSLNPISFTDVESSDLDLSHWRGKFVLLNIWATWCAPCREEMPTLDNLQRQLGGKNFEVVALSIDQAGVPAIQKFYTKIGIKHLAIYVDQTMKASTDLQTYGIPTTLLISPEGHELGRLVGPATWDNPEMLTFLRRIVNPKTLEP